MARILTQRQLRNDSGAIMRALDDGERFIVTRNGVAVGDLTPASGRRFVAREFVAGAFAGSPSIDRARMRADLDEVAAQDSTPRG